MEKCETNFLMTIMFFRLPNPSAVTSIAPAIFHGRGRGPAPAATTLQTFACCIIFAASPQNNISSG